MVAFIREHIYKPEYKTQLEPVAAVA
jgi:hypothetical protein